MLLSETLGTFVHQGKAIVKVLGDILQLNDYSVALAAKGRHFVLETDDQIVKTSEEGQVSLYLRVMLP